MTNSTWLVCFWSCNLENFGLGVPRVVYGSGLDRYILVLLPALALVLCKKASLLLTTAFHNTFAWTVSNAPVRSINILSRSSCGSPHSSKIYFVAKIMSVPGMLKSRDQHLSLGLIVVGLDLGLMKCRSRSHGSWSRGLLPRWMTIQII